MSRKVGKSEVAEDPGVVVTVVENPRHVVPSEHERLASRNDSRLSSTTLRRSALRSGS